MEKKEEIKINLVRDVSFFLKKTKFYADINY